VLASISRSYSVGLQSDSGDVFASTRFTMLTPWLINVTELDLSVVAATWVPQVKGKKMHVYMYGNHWTF